MPQDNKSDVIPAQKKKLNLRLGLNRREWLEAAAGQGAALADELTTERILHSPGGYEADPLARPLTKLPEPAYIAAGQGLTAGLTWAAHRLKHSHNRFLRGLGDVAQDIQIGANAGNAIRNSQLPVQHSQVPDLMPPIKPRPLGSKPR